MKALHKHLFSGSILSVNVTASFPENGSIKTIPFG